ncbi:MAG: fibro-slime domain-containing protein [Armatimonadetes bacterium]|nr:fibro-slime domain-containing protein [Armatimonadota bacterium]
MKNTLGAALGTALAAFALSAGSVAHAQAGFTVTGTIRDFAAAGTTVEFEGQTYTGNPDFQSIDFPSFTVEQGFVGTTIGGDLSDKPVYAGLNTEDYGDDSVSTAANFNQWFRDTPNVNVSSSIDFVTTQVSPGVFSFSNQTYFPIDGQSLGNQTFSRNYHFTTEIRTAFRYLADADATTAGVQAQTFRYVGDDDVFVYINGQLVIDLGGVRPQEGATVNLLTGAVDYDNASLTDQVLTLGLVDNQDYTLDIFTTERRTDDSTISFATNIPLTTRLPAVVPEAGTMSLFGMGLLGAAGMVLRRRK